MTVFNYCRTFLIFHSFMKLPNDQMLRI